uniref:RECQI1 n=1 Tax=Arundo donax TaxID=35708 RepID=A0A0A9G992_ARUDO
MVKELLWTAIHSESQTHLVIMLPIIWRPSIFFWMIQILKWAIIVTILSVSRGRHNL